MTTTPPTAREMYDAMRDLRLGKITADELRAVMRASREADPAGHDRRKAIAVANLDAASR